MTLQMVNESILKSTGINPIACEQGSDEWRKLKLGVISASEIDAVLAGPKTQTRATYMAELVAQIATGIPPEFNSKATEWGKVNERAARSAYEFRVQAEVMTVGFIYKDTSRRSGASLDGMVSPERIVEIKCPMTSKVHIETVCASKIKPEYQKQVQFQMFVTGANVCDFVSFDPRMKTNIICIVPVERDEEMMKLFDEKVPEFVREMDVMLAKLGIEFGAQWK